MSRRLSSRVPYPLLERIDPCLSSLHPSIRITTEKGRTPVNSLLKGNKPYSPECWAITLQEIAFVPILF